MRKPASVSFSLQKRVGIVDISGDITDTSETAILGAYQNLASQGAKQFLLRFQSDTFINSSGLRVLIGLALECTERKKSLRATGLSPHMQKVFEIVGLTSLIEVFETGATALKGR